MNKKNTLITLGMIFIVNLLAAQGNYKPKKVPSIPLNLQGLAVDIHEELMKVGKPLMVGDREYFSLDSRDNTMFEFMAYKTIGKSGERSIRFIMIDGKAYFARKVDEETSKIAQGVLYNDMKDRWEKYLQAKEREQHQQ